MLRGLASLIAPPLCGVCAESCEANEQVCGRCAAELAGSRFLPLNIPAIDEARALARYEGAARSLVQGLKFGRRLALAGVAAEAMAAALPGDAGPGPELVPVPPDPWRLRLRGFDPAARLASELARQTGLPLSHCLARPHRKRQVGSVRAERLASDLGVEAIAVPPRGPVLIDDVVTTGATLAACAAALRRAGSERILALAFARA